MAAVCAAWAALGSGWTHDSALLAHFQQKVWLRLCAWGGAGAKATRIDPDGLRLDFVDDPLGK